MNQTLHILRKDLRHLWSQLTALLLVILLHVFTDIRSSPQGLQIEGGTDSTNSLLVILLPLVIWFVIALLVLGEPLVGDKQFWITRPYRWPNLFAAKLLFLVACINLPLLISDCAILSAQSFPATSVIPQLLLRQFHIVVIFFIPALALAVISASTAQFLMFAFCGVLIEVLSPMLYSWLLAPKGVGSVGITVDMLEYGVVLTLLACVVLFQYARRTTATARLAVLAILLLTAPITLFVSHVLGAKASAQPLPDDSAAAAIKMEFVGSGIVRNPSSSNNGGAALDFFLPLSVSGLPPGSLIRGRGTTRFLTADGRQPDKYNQFGVSIETQRGMYILNQAIYRSYLNLNTPLNLETTLELEIVNDEPQVVFPSTAKVFNIPNVAQCRSYTANDITQLACRSGLQPHVETTLRVVTPAGERAIEGTFTQLEIPWAFSPTTDLLLSSSSAIPVGSKIEVVPRNKRATFHRTLHLSNFVPRDYIAPAPVDAQQQR